MMLTQQHLTTDSRKVHYNQLENKFPDSLLLVSRRAFRSFASAVCAKAFSKKVITGIACAFCVLITTPQTQAQSEYRRLEPPAKKSMIGSLSALHKKVKRNLFGREESPAPENLAYPPQQYQGVNDRARSRAPQYRDYAPDQYLQQRQRAAYEREQLLLPRAAYAQFEQTMDDQLRRSRNEPSYDAPQRYQPNRVESSAPAPGNQYQQDQYDEQRYDEQRYDEQRYDEQRYDEQRYDEQRYQTRNGRDDQRISQPPPPPPSSYNDTQNGSQSNYGAESQNARGPMTRPYDQQEHYQNSREPVREPVREPIREPQTPPARQPVENQNYGQSNQNQMRNQPESFSNKADYRTGHYQTENPSAQQPFSQQITATQRAIRLQEDNQRLRDAAQAATAENMRLTKHLREKNVLLQEIGKAIESARVELQNANQENETLRKDVAKLTAEKTNQMQASSSQLNAIRTKLDDVLMNEISGR